MTLLIGIILLPFVIGINSIDAQNDGFTTLGISSFAPSWRANSHQVIHTIEPSIHRRLTTISTLEEKEIIKPHEESRSYYRLLDSLTGEREFGIDPEVHEKDDTQDWHVVQIRDNEIEIVDSTLTTTDENNKNTHNRKLLDRVTRPRIFLTSLALTFCLLHRTKIQLSFVNLIKWYDAVLKTKPLLTKSITSGIFGCVGDYAAQWFEYRTHHKSFTQTVQSHPTLDTIKNDRQPTLAGAFHRMLVHGNFNARRSISILLQGIILTGPILHFGYGFFERVLPIGQSWTAAICHVVADSIFLDSFFVALNMVVSGLLEGYNFKRDILPQLIQDYRPALAAAWVTSVGLMPFEFVSFRFLPESWRSLSVNLIDIIWDGVNSHMAHKSRT